MNKHRVAFAGFGHSHIIGIYNEISQSDLFEVAGAWEQDETIRNNAEEKGVDFTFESFETLLNCRDIDTVAVGSEYGFRGKYIIKALEAGKNIISDKPLCTSLGELEKIEKLSKEKGLTVCVFLSLRQNPNIIGAVSAVRNGEIGTVNNIVFEGEHPLLYGKRPDWYFDKAKHGGVINDIAVHGIDLVRLMTGCNIKTVNCAREWNFYADERPEFKDSAQFMLTLESGAGVIGDVSYSAPDAHGYTHPSYWHFRVFGSLGMIEFGENLDKATLYPKNGDIKSISPLKPRQTMLEEFLSAVNGKIDSEIYTENMLEATRQTLIIEKTAEEI